VVELAELRLVGARAVAELARLEPAEQVAEIDDAGDADDRQGMVAAEGGFPVDVAADEEGLPAGARVRSARP